MANVGHWHVDNGGPTVNAVTLDDHRGLGNAGVYSDNRAEVVERGQAS